MHYSSPGRPLSSNKPAFITKNGEPVCPLYFPSLSPAPVKSDEPELNLTWWLPVPSIEGEAYTYTQKSLTIKLSWLSDVLEEYLQNPEHFLSFYLHYNFSLPSAVKIPRNKKENSVGITLAEL